MDNKDFKVEKAHVSHLHLALLFEGIDERFTFCATLGSVFLFDQSAGFHIIYSPSVAENSNGAGVMLT